MPHHALPAIKNLNLLSGEREIRVVLDEYCNKLRFNAQLNQLEIAVEDLILQDEDIEIFPLSSRYSITLHADSTQLHCQNRNELAQFESWFKQHIDSFVIY